MKIVKEMVDELNMGIIAAQCGATYGNRHQVLGIRLMSLSMCLAGCIPTLAAAAPNGPDLNTSINNGINFVSLLMKFVCIVAALAGLVAFIMGIVWAKKKTQPEYARDITVGQIFGGLLGGPALMVCGALAYMFINSFYGGATVGSTVQLPSS